jgi:hypothetical protein
MFSANYPRDLRFTDPEQVAKILAGQAARMKIPYFLNFAIIQLSVCGTIPGKALLSSLADHVLHVVALRTQEQVVRSNTSRIIAMMTNIQFSGNLTNE